MRKYNVGIIGCGDISKNYVRHAKEVYFDYFDITAVGDICVEKAQVLAHDFEIPKYGLPEVVYDDPGVDIIINLTVPMAHEEVTVKGVPTELFVYGVGEDFQIPEHWGFKASYAMKITSYCLSILMIICFICILVNIFNGFHNGKYFSRMQVILLRWGALFSFLLFIANELCEKFRMEAISLLYQGSSDVGLAVAFQIQTQDLLIPFLLLILAEIINIALGLNEEESMTI